MFEEFGNGERPFFNWMDEHPYGFVLEVGKSVSSGYAMIHRSNCSHLKDPYSGMKPDKYASRDCFNVCSLETIELIEWIKDYRPRVIKHTHIQACEDCKPELNTKTKSYTFEEAQAFKYQTHDVKTGKAQAVDNEFKVSQQVRKACLDYYGHRCVVCGVDFGEIHNGLDSKPVYIHHVHSGNQPFQSNNYREFDPVRDLKPVCCDCHEMIQSDNKSLPPEKANILLPEKLSRAKMVM